MPPIRPCALVILDGFGCRKEHAYNAIAQAHTPCLDMLWKTYPHTLLHASGQYVGLPEGYIGNSEVGHMTIGCGRIVPHPLTRINTEIEQGIFEKNPVLIKAFSTLAHTKRSLHIMGLLTDTGVHAHINHMIAYAKLAHQYHIKALWLHLFLDGRDSPPQSARSYLERLKDALKKLPNVHIGSLTGRFFAMDRNNNWERTCNTIDMLTNPDTAVNQHTPEEIISECYHNDITDEFIPPTLCAKEAQIQTGDGVVCTNFRADRIRQLALALTKPHDVPCKSPVPPLSFFIAPVSYGNSIATDTIVDTPVITKSLKHVLAAHHKTMFTIAETEKYAHVTYFFSGGHEEAFPGETRVLIPSIVTKHYVNHPYMSAPEITERVLKSLKTDPHDFYLINYANADMVGHSGNLTATIKAIECLDNQIRQLYEQIVLAMGGGLFITADHGNAEQMYDTQHNQPHTAHTTNPVPFIAVSKGIDPHSVTQLHELKDIAPFLLQQLNI